MSGNDFRDYLAFLRELGATLAEVTEVEKEKAHAVRVDDLERLNECMNREQALALTLRAYDQKRDAMLLLLDMKDVPLREMTARAPRECAEEAKETVEELCRQYALFRGAAEVARNTLECSLHQVELLLGAGASVSSGYPEEQAASSGPAWADFRA